MRKISLIIIGLCLSLIAEDAYHRRLLLPPCDAYGSSSGKLTLVNGGDCPVRLRLIRYSCHCLSGKFQKETIEPGGKIEVEFTLSPNGKGGTHRQKAWLEFEWDRTVKTVEAQKNVDAEDDSLILTNQIQVEVQVLLLSRLRLGLDMATLDFHDDDATIPQTVQLTGSAREATITEVKQPEHSHFRYELSEDKRSLIITAVYDRRLAKRNVMENWIIQTSDEKVPQLSLALNLHVKHDYTITPDAIEMNANGKLPVNGCLLIKSTNMHQPVKVLRADWENAEGKVEIRQLPRGLSQIAYTLEKMTEEGKTSTLRIYTNSKLQEEVVVVVGQR